MQQAVLDQIVEIVSRQKSRSSSEFTYKLLGNCDFPLVETIPRLERHFVPHRLSMGWKANSGRDY
jgi:hypothetical protein